MTPDGTGAAALLKALLRGPCATTNACRRGFAAGHLTEDEVIVSHRLIHVVDGRLDYAIDGRGRRLGAGDWTWVPAWSRRSWTAARGGCELCWAEFTTDPVSVPAGWHLATADQVVVARHDALARAWPARDELGLLRAEAEIKALAAAFWSRAAGRADAGPARQAHAEVARAAAWLGENFARAGALEEFYHGLGLSPNHFRLLYRRETGETVQATLARLRLRKARYLVAETTLSVKEIAAECGFADPLYFSNHYRRFWGRPPSADRGGGAAA